MIAIYATTGVLLAFDARETLRSLSRLSWLIGFVLFIGLSAQWSTDPNTTAKTWVWFVGTTLFGVYLNQRFSRHDQVTLLALALALVVLFSFIFALAWPRLGIDPGLHANAWRGVFIHKNSLGRIMVLAMIVFSLLLLARPRFAPILALGLGGAAVLLLQSRSATALSVAAGLLVLLPLSWVLRSRHGSVSRAALLGALLASGAVLAVLQWGEVLLQLLGRDSTFSGRTLLWASVLQEVAERPWLGYGYHAFWNGRTAEFADVWRLVGWAPPHAHNGFLDLLLNVGIVGGVLFVVGLGAYTHVASRLTIAHRSEPLAIWPLAVLAYTVLTNFTESTLLRHTSIFSVVLVSVICGLDDVRHAERSRHRERIVDQVEPARHSSRTQELR